MSQGEAPRLAPVPLEARDDDVRAALVTGYGRRRAEQWCTNEQADPPMPNAVATMLHHPGIAGPWLAYNNVLFVSPSLDPRLRELMVLRVAWRTRAPYEWVQHVRIALEVGITRDEIDVIAGLTDTAAWSPLETDLLDATDQLIDGYRVDDVTWARLAETLDERQLVEVVFVVGTYTCLAMAFNSFGLELDPDLDAVPAPEMPDVGAS
ncbi:MAG TPA: carboxymuconolactone decarboxylase family protein [Acidimicrobiia bacterium]|nr:carboxymuconolactone decarboxylase family protein [Acidimicrobiia bacterium]